MFKIIHILPWVKLFSKYINYFQRIYSSTKTKTTCQNLNGLHWPFQKDMNWCTIRNKYHLVPSVGGYQFKGRDIFVSSNVCPLLPFGEIVSLHGDIQYFLKANVDGNKKKTNWNNLIVNGEKILENYVCVLSLSMNRGK